MQAIKSALAIAIMGAVVLLVSQITSVHAGGLYVTEAGHPAMGASGAGAGTLAEDASTAATNPAGIVKLDKGQWMFTAIGIFTKAEFEQESGTTVTADGSTVPGSGSNGGDAGGAIMGASAFYARPISERWGFGFAFNSFSGAALDYENGADFVGRYWAQEIELLTVTASPSVAFKISDNFSIAASIPVLFGRLEMDVAIASPIPGGSDGLAQIKDGEDISVTGSVSALWDVNDRNRIGLLYVGENEVEFDSDLDLTLPSGASVDSVDADIELTFPQTLRLSASRDISDRTTLLAMVAWEDWSTLDSVPISTPTVSGALPRNWDDTWRYAFGARIRAGEKWTWYTGAAYDTDPTSSSDRTADMPVDRQIRLSGGATWAKGERMTLGGAITLADLGEAAISNGGTRPISGVPWNVVGEYDTNRAAFVAFNLGWK